jgi:hypothetical protein
MTLSRWRITIAIMLSLTASAAAPRLEARVHFLHGWEGGDPILLYYRITNKERLEPKTLRAGALPIKRFGTIEAFGKRELEIIVEPKLGLDVTFDTLTIDGSKVSVKPSRVLYLKPKTEFEINYERMEQLPNKSLFLGMRIFNDSPKTVVIEKILYAPKGVSSDRVLINEKFDPAFFSTLETWARNGGVGVPKGTTLKNSSALGLKVAPGKAFGAAVVNASFQKAFSCEAKNVRRDPKLRFDTAYLSPIIIYRVGEGQPQSYPIPDQIIADLCP